MITLNTENPNLKVFGLPRRGGDGHFLAPEDGVDGGAFAYVGISDQADGRDSVYFRGSTVTGRGKETKKKIRVDQFTRRVMVP